MNDYRINNIVSFPENSEGCALLDSGIFIIVLHAKKTPPHLAISINGLAFSLTVNGPKLDWKCKDLLKLVVSKKIKILFFQLGKIPPSYSAEKLFSIAKGHTLYHLEADIHRATCLYPLKCFCSSVYRMNMDKVQFIFDLLPRLYERSIIEACYHQNMKEDIVNGTYYLGKYTMKEVDNMILNYKTKQAI
jgi:hypothetical protein